MSYTNTPDDEWAIESLKVHIKVLTQARIALDHCVTEGRRVIQLSRTGDHSTLNSEDREKARRLAKIEDGWENDAEAVFEVLSVIAPGAWERPMVDTLMELRKAKKKG